MRMRAALSQSLSHLCALKRCVCRLKQDHTVQRRSSASARPGGARAYSLFLLPYQVPYSRTADYRGNRPGHARSNHSFIPAIEAPLRR
jgi:hypothetical protein